MSENLYGRGTLLAIGAVVALYAGITAWKLKNPVQPPGRPDKAAAASAADAGQEGVQGATVPVAGIPWTPDAAVTFDGVSSYSSVDLGPASDALLDGRHPASVALWFKRSELRGDALFIKGADPFMCLAHFSATEPQKLYFYFKRGSDAASIRVYADGFDEAGEWIHLGVTYDGSGRAGGVSIYKNGAPQKVAVVNDGLDGPVENTGPVMLGAYRSAEKPGWFFSGALAWFHVMDRALSAEDVVGLAASPPPEN